MNHDRCGLRFCGVILAAVVAGGPAATASGDVPASAVAKYHVTLVGVSPPRFSIRADLPIRGGSLEMDSSYPAELPEMAAKGWPALISNLKAQDSAGKPIELTSAGAGVVGRSHQRGAIRPCVVFVPLGATSAPPTAATWLRSRRPCRPGR